MTPSVVLLLILASSSSGFSKSKAPPPSVSGDVLIAGGVTSSGSATASAEFYHVATRRFFATASMGTARAGLQAQTVGVTPETTAPIVFVFGGFSGTASFSGSSFNLNATDTASIETFDGASETFSPYAASMFEGRSLFASVAFPGNFAAESALDGHILVVGGLGSGGLASTGEALDPTDIEDGTGNPNDTRVFHTATLLNDGSVLVTGGIDDLSGDVVNTAELFDPVSFNYFFVPSTMNTARAGHTATLLGDGTVLIAGGVQGSGGSLTGVNSAEIYDPVAQTFTTIGATMHDNRSLHTASMLPGGTVLLAGGFSGNTNVSIGGGGSGETLSWSSSSGATLRTAEIYDPASQTFSCVKGVVKKTGACKPSLKAARMLQTATNLATGDILLVGGLGTNKKSGSVQALGSAETFHAGKFKKTHKMTTARVFHAASVLP